MSASERLKALKANMDGFHAPLVVKIYVDALPEIIAVVEAVEKALDQDYGDGPPTMEIGVALAALDAKLTTKGER